MFPGAIFIEAGHGKSAIGLPDPGAIGRIGERKYTERELNKQIAERIRTILIEKEELKGSIVQGVGILTDAAPYKKMTYVNTVLRENRLPPAKSLGVSIHLNSSVSNKPTGMEVWYQQKGLLAEKLGRQVVSAWDKYKILPLRPKPLLNTKDHWKYRRLYIDDALCPFVLVEVGFISNPQDLMTILKNLDRTAEAIAHGIMNFVRSQP